MINDMREILLSEEELKEIVNRVAKQISRDYKDKKLYMIGILKGSVVFLTDLMRALDIPCEIDFMVVSSYGSGVTSSGNVKIIKDVDVPLEGKYILIVEDILDTGNTLKFVSELLLKRNPNSLQIATLLDKPSRRVADVTAKYIGAEIEDKFVVGYGLDYDEKYRNVPCIGVLKPEIYMK